MICIVWLSLLTIANYKQSATRIDLFFAEFCTTSITTSAAVCYCNFSSVNTTAVEQQFSLADVASCVGKKKKTAFIVFVLLYKPRLNHQHNLNDRAPSSSVLSDNVKGINAKLCRSFIVCFKPYMVICVYVIVRHL